MTIQGDALLKTELRGINYIRIASLVWLDINCQKDMSKLVDVDNTDDNYSSYITFLKNTVLFKIIHRAYIYIGTATYISMQSPGHNYWNSKRSSLINID